MKAKVAQWHIGIVHSYTVVQRYNGILLREEGDEKGRMYPWLF